MQRPCPMCLGKGQIPSERCPTCNGSGEVRVRKKMMITVPPGVDTGTKLRLKGQGGRGLRNGPPGDLLISFQVEPDRFFKREGLDIVAPVTDDAQSGMERPQGLEQRVVCMVRVGAGERGQKQAGLV